MARLSIALFGPLQVSLDGGTIAFESDKVRALLAYLVVEARDPQRREKLAGLLWSDWPEESARNNLRHTLAVLRKTIGDREASLTCPEHHPPDGPILQRRRRPGRRDGLYRAPPISRRFRP